MSTLHRGLGAKPVTPGLPVALPTPRGPITEHLLEHLTRPLHEVSQLPLTDTDPLTDPDTALALYLCYELHYLGLPGVDEAWEWEPTLLRERHRLEHELEQSLRQLAGPVPMGLTPETTVEELLELTGTEGGPSLSDHMVDHGTLEQVREFAVHRSPYQLREADPHTWGIPRLTGRAKTALVDMRQAERRNGAAADVHALYTRVLEELELDPTYGAYLDRLPGITLSTCNLVSMFGLHRRWRGALVGHLALFEMGNVRPMGRHHAALEWLGLADPAPPADDEAAALTKDQVLALHDMVAGLLEQEPFLGGEVVFGAKCLATVDHQFTEHLLTAWGRGESSLLPAPAA